MKDFELKMDTGGWRLVMETEKLKEFYRSTIPQKVWEMDRDSFNEIKKRKDAAGTYYWRPEPDYPDMPGTFFGIPISVATTNEKCFQIKYIFPDGHTHTIKMEKTN